MTRIAGGGAIAVGVMVAVWVLFARHAVAPAPVSTVLLPLPGSRARESPGGIGSREVALYQEIVRARQAALKAAQVVVPPQAGGRLPSAPSGVFQKGAAKREEIASAGASKMLADIAQGHGMTREEIEDLYRRGEAEGWPGIP